MIELPNKKKCYNLPEQVAQNLLNIQYLAEQYKNIDELPAIWADYKTAFDADLHTFEDWTTTFEGWENTLATYLSNMSSAAVGAIAGQNIAPDAITAINGTFTNDLSGHNITGDSIIENMIGYSASIQSQTGWTYNKIYISAVKNGNKLTLVSAINITKTDAAASDTISLVEFMIPASVRVKLYPTNVGGSNFLDLKPVKAFESLNSNIDVISVATKTNGGVLFGAKLSSPVVNTVYYLRQEVTFLLSDDIA